MARKLIINGGAIRPTGLLLSPGVGSLVGQPQITNGPPSYIYGAPMVVLQRWANRGSADHANGGPTTHLSLVYRWANGGSTEAYRWLAIVGPTAHLSLVYRWPTVGPTVTSHRWANRGPPVASHRWPNGGPTEAHRWLATGGPTEARWTRPQWATGGCHRWPNSALIVGVPLAHRWANGG